MDIPRFVSPLTNPNAYIAAAGAIVAVVTMTENIVHNHGPFDATVIVSAIGAVGALAARQLVTPVLDPKDASGTPLVPVPQPPAPAPPAAGVTA